MTVLRRSRLWPLITLLTAALMFAAAAVTWLVATRTQPGLCMLEQNNRCVYELTPRRDGQVTVFMDVEGLPYRHDTMPAACLRPGPVEGVQCPRWVVEWDPTRAVGDGVVAPPSPK